MLQGKKILLGVTGSIAAYKAILLVRLLVKAGAEVKVITTKAAAEFVSPLVLSTLSKNKVLQDLSTNDEWANHVQLGRWADVFLIAPLSCNSLAKMANGFCDNLLLATYLSATCPVVVAPAMDEDMWHHPTTKKNIQSIINNGNQVISVQNGELASGLFGEGRMAEPEEIVTYLIEHFFRQTFFQNKKVLITAGPTYEAIDPVRFIGNHSSGKMGFALAEAMYLQGADVTIITGPTAEKLAFNNIKRVDVTSAAEMFEACNNIFQEVDIAIMSAAVADYKPNTVATEKIKKKADDFTIHLEKTNDILFELGKQKKEHQFLAGFALETNNELENALDKLVRKNANCIILNSLQDKQAGFQFDTNKITILSKSGEKIAFDLKSKKEVAEDIVSYIYTQVNV